MGMRLLDLARRNVPVAARRPQVALRGALFCLWAWVSRRCPGHLDLVAHRLSVERLADFLAGLRGVETSGPCTSEM